VRVFAAALPAARLAGRFTAAPGDAVAYFNPG
jgi:hypothetical protein